MPLTSSLPEPTRAEAFRIAEAKLGPCIPCMMWAAAGNMPDRHVAQGGDYHHCLSGGIRRGHRFGFCNCGWHHRALALTRGWNHARMRAYFGPSLQEGSVPFIEAYGDDDTLIAVQDKVLDLMAKGLIHKGMEAIYG